jgi:hypothetical protein
MRARDGYLASSASSSRVAPTVMPMGVDFRVGLEELLTACRRVAPALGQDRPVHGAIRVSERQGSLIVEAHSGELHFRSVAGGGMSQSFDPMLIPGRLFLRFLRSLEATGLSTVVLKVDAAQDLVVEADQASMKLRLIASDLWPSLEPTTAGATALSPEDLERMRSVLFAVSGDIQKGALVGVRVKGPTVTGLDNTRLAQVTLDAELADCLVPADFLRESMRESVGQVHWSSDASRAILLDERGFWSATLLSHQFPDDAVTDLLGRSTESLLAVRTEALRTALNRVGVLESARVQLSARNGVATLRT